MPAPTCEAASAQALRHRPLRPPPAGTLPLKADEIKTLHEALREVPDPKSGTARFRVGAVLTIAATALMAGGRDMAEIHRYASKLPQKQHRNLILPLSRTPHKPSLRRVPRRFEVESCYRLI